MMEHPSGALRWVFYLGAVFQAVACAGAIFGFTSMSTILVSVGAFSELCPDASTECSAQTLALNQVYNVAAITSFASPVPIGIFLDRQGPRRTVLLCILVFSLGPALVIVANALRISNIYYPAFVCFGFSASSMLMPLYNIANVFEGAEGLALGLLNGSFDAGSLVFMVMARMHDAGVPLQTIMISYLAAPVAVVWLLALFLWRNTAFVASAETELKALQEEQQRQLAHPAEAPRRSVAPIHFVLDPAPSPQWNGEGSTGKSRGSRIEGVVAVSDTTATAAAAAAAASSSDEESASSSSATVGPRTPLMGSRSSPRDGGGKFVHKSPSAGSFVLSPPTGTPVLSPPPNKALLSPTEPSLSSTSTADVSGGGHLASTSAHPLDDAPSSAHRLHTPSSRKPPLPFDSSRLMPLSFRDQLLSREWLSFAAFFALCILRFNFFIGSVDAQLTAFGQSDHAYTTIFGIILPLGFFGQFAIGPILDRYGIVVGLLSLWGLGVLFSALNLVPSLPVQAANFALFALFRAFIFTNMVNYMAAAFGVRNLGKLIGAVVLCGGLVGLLQSPLLSWALSSGSSSGSGDFTAPNALLLALMVAAGAFPLSLLWTGRPERWAAAAASTAGEGRRR